jgi:hypothetical protein
MNQTSRRARTIFTFSLGIALAVSASLAISTTPKGSTVVPGFSTVVGGLSQNPVKIDKVEICACWIGPRGQSQKKLKFRIANNSAVPIRIAGGRTSDVYLIVAYHGDFVPVITMPSRTGAQSQFTPEGHVPPNQTVYVASIFDKVPAIEVDDRLARQLGVTDGWKAWALSANPNAVEESTNDSSNTFPTFVAREKLAPGESYYETGYGLGDWVFYLPLPPDIANATEWPGLPVVSGFWDPYYLILGVAVIDPGRGSILGFAPVPPESAWTEGAEF